MKKVSIVLFLAFLSILSLAQHNNRSVRNLQFRFDNPGARALGIGGAFTGMADDATAALANPAGITQLSNAAFTVETTFLQYDYEIPFYAGDIVQTNLFEFDFQFEPKGFSDSQFEVPFLSYVKPFESFHLGFFFSQQAKVERSYTTESISIFPLDSVIDQVRYFPTQDEVDILLQNVGISIARAFSDSLSLGATLLYGQMDYLANSTSLAENAIGEPTPAYQRAEGDDNGLGYYAGLFYQPNQWLSLGVAYKSQPEFNYTASLEQPVVIWQEDFETEAIFKVPDSLSVGMSYRITEFTLLMFDVQRVFYSQLSDDFIDFNGIPGLNQTVKDATELHAGLEHTIAQGFRGLPLTLRVGYWLEPYHAPLNNFDDNQLLEGTYGGTGQINFRDSFFLHQFSEDVSHITAGMGLGLSRKAHLDWAVDYSEDNLRTSLGLVMRLGD